MRVLGVVAENEKACARVPLDEAIGLGAQVFLKSIQTSLHAIGVLFLRSPSPGGKKKA